MLIKLVQGSIREYTESRWYGYSRDGSLGEGIFIMHVNFVSKVFGIKIYGIFVYGHLSYKKCKKTA